jgi:hypothetical protein
MLLYVNSLCQDHRPHIPDSILKELELRYMLLCLLATVNQDKGNL